MAYLKEASVDTAGSKDWMLDDLAQEFNICGQTNNFVLLKCAIHQLAGNITRRACTFDALQSCSNKWPMTTQLIVPCVMTFAIIGS